MKDYRTFKRINVEEWEQDKEWLGNRLDFLWCIREYDTELYMNNGLNLEKNDFYDFNDREVSKIASDRHYSVDIEGYDNRYRDVDLEEQHQQYKDLEYLRKTNLKKFLNKNNCNLYDYLHLKKIDGLFDEYI